MPILSENFQYYYFAYTYIPAPHSLIENVYKLPPAHSMIISKNGETKVEKYWNIDCRKKLTGLSEEEYKEMFLETVSEATRIRLREGETPAVMLSGGFDSSTIVAMMQMNGTSDIKTFATFYEVDKENHPDWKYSQLTSSFFHTDHYNAIYKFENLNELIPLMIDCTDEPNGVVNFLMVLFLYQYMKEHDVKVVFSGNGGDEIFGGYGESYVRVRKISDLYKLLDMLPKGLWASLYFMLNSLGKDDNILQKAARRFKGLSLPLEKRLSYFIESANNRIFENLLPGLKSSKVNIGDLVEKAFINSNADNFFDGLLYTQLMMSYLFGNAIMSDYIGSVVPVVTRSPFLDHKVVEFASSLPVDMRVRRSKNGNRYLMKKALQGILPDAILNRGNFGFSGITSPLLTELYKTKWSASFFEEPIFSGRLKKLGVFNMRYIENLWKEFKEAGVTSQTAIKNSQILYMLSVLEFWYNRYF
jgi:asparagine synthase (glutamine-hydrolysing)